MNDASMTNPSTPPTTAPTGRAAATRDRLLTAAIEAFGELGYAGTTTRDIASRAGMSPAAVYVHHAAKEDLLFAVSQAGHLQSLEVIRAASLSTDDPIDRVRAMVHDFSLWHAQSSRVARIVQYELNALSPDHRTEIAGYRRAIEREMQVALRDGVSAGVMDVADVKGTALAILSLSIDLARWFVPDGSVTAESLARLHADLAAKMVSTP